MKEEQVKHLKISGKEVEVKAAEYARVASRDADGNLITDNYASKKMLSGTSYCGAFFQYSGGYAYSMNSSLPVYIDYYVAHEGSRILEITVPPKSPFKMDHSKDIKFALSKVGKMWWAQDNAINLDLCLSKTLNNKSAQAFYQLLASSFDISSSQDYASDPTASNNLGNLNCNGMRFVSLYNGNHIMGNSMAAKNMHAAIFQAVLLDDSYSGDMWISNVYLRILAKNITYA